MDKLPNNRIVKDSTPFNSIVVIGNHLPRLCGIATFTTHLLEAITANSPDTDCWAVAMNDHPDGYDYPSPVKLEINQNQCNDYKLVADSINLKNAGLVCVQHEYGIFGGERGSYVIELLKHLKAPVVTTLHTILKDPTCTERHIIMELGRLSDRLVVMSERSRDFLRDIYQIDPQKIVLIPHGIPDVPQIESSFYKDKIQIKDRQVALTFGLLSPGKGIETMIKALPSIVEKHPDLLYMIVGATHPHLKADQGESYRTSLSLLAKKLGVESNVDFHDQFVSDDDLKTYIGAADIFVTPYLSEAQIISGTLAYTVGMGKAVISTPYWHAQELLADGRGILFPFNDSERLSDEVISLLDDPDKLHSIQNTAYDYGRQMIWNEVGQRYVETFQAARSHRLREYLPDIKQAPFSIHHQPLPDIRLDHLLRMTDDVGILQHARFSVPQREHGYCVDDNARALIVAVAAQELKPQDASLTNLTTVYLSFIDHAFNTENGLFRNFMSYQRSWLEDTGSEDSNGRVMWSLGETILHSQQEREVRLADDLFQRALPMAEKFSSPRAIAFTIIGSHAFLTRHPDNGRVESSFRQMANKLMAWFKGFASEDWPWCEETVTYDNARIAQALLHCGSRLADKDMIDTALLALNWLSDIQRDESGSYFAAIGNDGWYSKQGKKPAFDQQPIEAAAMVDACVVAFQVTQDGKWITRAYRCFNWFRGDNELHLPLYNQSTGGCHDGLQHDSVNENQGAESGLCWLMALFTLHKYRNQKAALLPRATEPTAKKKVVNLL